MSLRLISLAPSSDAAYRTALIASYLIARSSRERLAIRNEALVYDRTNPGASLMDELLGARLGDVA
ncbi:hypothetical protein AB0C91_10240 [Streptomyces sp. NPDC048674]|uniref:hypothetical protein n=1 Tax=Streptomyces sp. NPDC048674 TaxID=3155491 RepID=UPI003427D9CA